MTARFYRLLVGTGVVFALSLVLALLDGAGWLVLPQPLRPALLAALVLSTLVGIVLLSGSIGMPKKPPPPEASGGGKPEPEIPKPGAPETGAPETRAPEADR